MNDSARDNLLMQATSAHQAGNLQQAEANYRQLWDQQQDDNLGYLLGTLLLQKGDAAQAIDYLSPIAARNLQSADLQNNLGIAFQMQKNYEQALNAFQAALQADREYPPVYHNLGKFFVEVGNFPEAENCYRKAVHLSPEDLSCHEEWIQVLIQLEKWEPVITEIHSRLENDPGNNPLRTNLVFAYAKMKNYEAAIQQCQIVLQHQPDSLETHSNLSYLYEHTGQLDLAIASAQKGCELAPQSAEVANNLGIAYRSNHQIELAIDTFNKAIQLAPDFTLAKFNLGSTQLLNKQYPEGWQHYESRRGLMALHPDLEAIPAWQGETISGKTLLVSCDQGFGDAIQFARFVPKIKQVSQAEIILQTSPELTELFRNSSYQNSPLADQIISETDNLPTVDYHFSIASAGAQFQFALSEVGIEQSYLQSPTGNTGSKNNAKQGLKKIGLCWRGNPNQAQDYARSMQLSQLNEQLRKLAKQDQIKWISLQQDATKEELAGWCCEIENRGNSLQSFTETATVLDELDLLITVDTAIAHLAGAMMCPVWTLLPHTPDWRWHLNQTDSPWYPSMKLFRQPTWGDWNSAVKNTQEELDVFLSDR